MKKYSCNNTLHSKCFKKNIHRAERISDADVFLAIAQTIENFPLSKNPYTK